MSKLEVITGCMFAGKTDEMLRRLRRAEIAGQRVEIVKPEIDDRYGQETVSTHHGREWDARVVSVDDEGFKDLKVLEADVIAVDEFNFFNERFLHMLQQRVDMGVRVIICGLDQTYRSEPFEPMHKALAVADDVMKLSAICEVCGEEATRSQRLVNGDPAPADLGTIAIGGSEKFEARCRSCHEVPKKSVEMQKD